MAMQGDREQCLAAGMDDYITKPFSRTDLHALLTRWGPKAAATCEPAAAPTMATSGSTGSTGAADRDRAEFTRGR